MNGYPSFYPRIALVAPSPGLCVNLYDICEYADITFLDFLELKTWYDLCILPLYVLKDNFWKTQK